MKNKAYAFLGFVLGAAVGAIVTRHFLKDYYEQITQEELESIRESFFPPEPDAAEEPHSNAVKAEVMDESHSKPTLMEYAAIIRQERYGEDSGNDQTQDKESQADETPYVISPEEFAENDEYEKIGLTYYSDGVLETDDEKLVENVEELVGPDALSNFGVYEDDCVHVRDDTKKCDYEILLDERSYAEIAQERTPKTEME